MFKINLKYLELPDLPDFKAEEPPISKSAGREKLVDIAKKPKSVKNVFKRKKPQEKKSLEKEIKPKHHFILMGGHRIKSIKELKESIKFMDNHTLSIMLTKTGMILQIGLRAL